MAGINQSPDGTWHGRYRDSAGKEHARHFARKRDARQWLDEVASSLTGQNMRPNAGGLTFRWYAECWLYGQGTCDGTVFFYRRRLRQHSYPILGDMRMRDILPSTIQAWVNALIVGDGDERAPLTPSAVGVLYEIVATIFRDAVLDRQIARTPCVNVKLPEVVKVPVTPMTTSQLLCLADAVPPELKALVTFTASTGMRQGEVLGLTRDRLNMLGTNPSVTIDRQLITKTGGEPDLGRLDSKAAYRTIPLPGTAIDALNEHIATYKVGAGELLFVDTRMLPFTRQRLGHAWRPAAARAGLTDATGRGLDALRHYYAGQLIRDGGSVKMVQDRLGHKSRSETLDTYSHLWEDAANGTRDAVDSTPRDVDACAD